MTALTATVYPAGTAPAVAYPGDFILTRDAASWHSRQGFLGGLIRFGQRLRINKRWCWCNHAAGLVTGGPPDQAVLVEMLGHGATVTPLSAYTARDYVLVTTFEGDTADPRRQVAVDYWNWLAATHVGYGYVSIVAIGLSLLSGARFGVSFKDRPVCSAAVAGGLGLNEWRACPGSVMPADLARHWSVTAPTTGSTP